jgi:predicted nucleic acid-binding protein
MKVYADTSVLVAWFHPADFFASAVRAWLGKKNVDFIWNPLLRVELRHTLRRLSGSYARVAWDAYRASETAKRLVIDVRRINDFLEWGDELSAALPADLNAGTWDCIHVAAALHSGADVFLTCDTAQAEVARRARLSSVHLFK